MKRENMPKYILPYIFLLHGLTAFCQNIVAVHIEGKVRICNQGENETQAKTLMYGPISNTQRIILGQRAKVKLIRSTGEQCEITNAGMYNVSGLQFSKTENSSFLSKMGDFIMSFLQASHSSESKDSYKNSISAISRGDFQLPVLDFPLTGQIPDGMGALEFQWSHFCDTCIYALEIYDLSTREKLFSVSTSKSSYNLKNTGTLLKAGKAYYWTVKVRGVTAEYASRSFTVAAPGAFTKSIQDIENQLIQGNIVLQIAPKTMYVMKSLHEQGQLNYALLYGRKQVQANKRNDYLRKAFEAFYYSSLKQQFDSIQ